MKKTFLLLTLSLFGLAVNAQKVQVISHQKVAQGYYPVLNADASELSFLASENETYVEAPKGAISVSNEDLKLVLYRNGERTELYPHGTQCNYVWASLSPDQTKILFNTKFGTGICDLQGQELINLGPLDAPVWYGNDYVVGMYDTSDGHNYTGSSIAICSTDGRLNQVLTEASEMGMYPSVCATTGQIAYNTLDGDIYLLQTNLTEQPIRSTLPHVVKAQAAPAVKRLPAALSTKTFSDYKIYINPGHGGFTSDDRNVKIYPFASGDPKGFWESQSNLDKGLHLRDMLNALGFQTMMSRVTNTQDDDRSLSGIVAEANTYRPDFFLSIHSNAGGPSNYVLQLYAGVTPGDTHVYPTATPCSDESREISTVIANNQFANAITTWSHNPRIDGDKTFGRTIMGWSNGYGVLRGLRVPGTISEGCMHDYIPEAYRLMNMDYKWQESYNFLRSFCSYFMNYTLPTGVIGGQVRDSCNLMEFPAITKIRNSRDELLPLNQATVELVQNGQVLQTYTTDTLYNGVFFFWDLPAGNYTLRLQAAGYYPLQKDITVTAGTINYKDLLAQKERSTRPEVVSYSPCVELTDSVEVASDVVLNFNWDMVPESVIEAFSITPAVEGTLRFENSYRTVRFSPATKFEKGVEYTVTLLHTAHHPDANFPNEMAEDFTFRFRTKNRADLSLLRSYPSAGMQDVPVNPSFIMIFDEKLYTPSGKTSVAVKDEQGNVQAINPRSFTYNKASVAPNGYMSFELTAALEPNKDYKLCILSTLKDQVGVFFNNPVEIPFRTRDMDVVEIPMVNDMEVAAFEYNADESLGVRSGACIKETTRKLFGTASNKLMYTFNDDEAFATFKYTGTDLLEGNGNCRFGAYIFSDFSGNQLFAKWNADGDIKYTLLGTMDYAGWKYLEADMSALPVDVDYQFMGLYLVRGNDLLSSDGSIYVDNMTFERVATAVENVLTDAPKAQKIVDTTTGQVYILKDGKRYNVLGVAVEK